MRATRTRTGALKAKPSRFFDDQNTLSSDSEVVDKKASKGRGSSRPAKKPRINLENESDGDFVGENDKRTSTTSCDHPFSIHAISISDIHDIRKRLLDWFEGVHDKRGMPWRKRYDASLDNVGRAQRAYEVWISEVMLQQTQVATVKPYYIRWMERFPTIQDLAASDIEAVNNLWKGLGYYSRAARLLSGAKKAVESYNGLLPDNARDLITNIPGIGRYSAGAISSIAYNHCEPVLDGNVNRLLSRFLALHAGQKAKLTLEILWTGATAMIEKSDRPGDINQALIELGSTVCKVRDPACGSCPFKTHCKAYKEIQGVKYEETEIEELCTICEPFPSDGPLGVTKYPMKCSKKKAREEIDVVSVIEWDSSSGSSSVTPQRYFLLVRRPEKGLLANLHEFPTLSNVGKEVSSDAGMKKAAMTVLRSMLKEQPVLMAKSAKAHNDDDEGSTLRVVHIKPAGDVLHIFSHIRKTYRVQWVLITGGDSSGPPVLQKPTAESISLSKKPKKTKRAKAEIVADGDVEDIDNDPSISDITSSSCLRWVQEADVVKANIGTGVMKVWKKAKTLWEDDGS